MSANSETITSLILEVLKNCELDTKKLRGLVTEGPSVMVGKRSSVATRLKEANPSIINIYCICHRLAFYCTDSNKKHNVRRGTKQVSRQALEKFL